MTLISGAEAAALDREAAADWGLSPCALVEAAGRACAEALYPVLAARRFSRLLVLAGSGNNGADALVMLRALLVRRGGLFSDVGVLLSKLPDENGETGKTPRAQAVLALRKMGVAVRAWNAADAESLRRPAALIIDGIAGTGISGPLGGTALDMLNAANAARETAGVVSIDIPSGASDDWKPGYPVVSCDCCLAVEPLKACLYTPSLRSRAGDIIPVTGIFPPALTAEYAGRSARELRGWTEAAARVPPVPAGAYKYRRGVVEIRAGSAGSTGAARIAAAGAGAAGAGLVRLGVDESIYPLLAANAGGVMVYPASQNPDFARPRFKPDAILLGPGWGREAARRPVLEKALEAEASGVPLVLDADAIALAADCVFSGSTILTPHAGELAAFAGVPRDRLACESEILNEIAREKNAVILFKSHVMIVADGRRLVFIDGMNAALGAGGSGDLLAGLCAAIAARLHASREAAEDADARLHAPRENAAALLGDCAAAAAALLVEAARRHGRRFFDPLDLAESAARAAGEAWLRRGGL